MMASMHAHPERDLNSFLVGGRVGRKGRPLILWRILPTLDELAAAANAIAGILIACD